MRTPWGLGVSLIFVACAGAAADDSPKNLGFEEGSVGQAPPGWVVTTAAYRADLVEGGAKEGKRCVRFHPAQAAEEPGVGILLQPVDARSFRGKAVRLRAALRVEEAAGGDGRAQLWMRVDRPGEKPGFFDNMSDRPVRARDWTTAEIRGDVAGDAEMIYVGLLAFGGAAVRMDDVRLDVAGDAEPIRAGGPRPLTPRGLDNLVAFTRLLGLVRHFHPSDEAAAADWERLAVAGVLEVEPAKDTDELCRKLRAVFAPVAPTARIYLTGQAPPPVPEALTNPPAGGRVVAWIHRGYGAKPFPAGLLGNVYSSRRGSHTLVDGKLPPGAQDPADAFPADLGAGVSCLVPIALYADESGTRPAVPKGEAPKPVAGRLTGDDRATRLADVILIWNILEHFYPYFDVARADWPATLRLALESAATDKDGLAFLATLRRMVASLRDGHGNVVFGEQPPAGPLPIRWDWVEGKLVVTEVAPEAGGPDVRRGDVVRAIDGRPAAEVVEDAERLISAATPQWARWNALRAIANGPPGSRTTLGLERADGTFHRASLIHAEPGMPPSESRPPKVAEVRPGIFYVDLDRVSDADFREALPRLEKASGIVFDFRGYPSRISPDTFFPHLVDHPVASPQWHIPTILKPGRGGMTFDRGGEWSLRPAAPFLKARRAFLIDGRAISYAESCLGIVEHEHLGELVGGPTAGTNGNINVIDLPGGYKVVFTGMKVLKHDGSRHHGVGIRPTVPVSRTIRGVAEGKDEALEKAIGIVGRP
ncbi:Peptidase family S41 [Aquisphaera giovannonii]|uniref:Peptidase family S41 n=1 Tax=Aquisphaera giovannonii TaxID=406548 RepID=A0A5B9WCE2_9BACT|nr:S41 family peptidase [Aquisphaera giovannonii]QEH37715.1 Peptidase family S41 [Aquisphaera giovannonii]